MLNLHHFSNFKCRNSPNFVIAVHILVTTKTKENKYNKNGHELVRVRGSALRGAVILSEERNMRTVGYIVNHICIQFLILFKQLKVGTLLDDIRIIILFL